jgi:hypothetical protein
LERVYTGIGQLRRRDAGGTGRVLSAQETELLEKINAWPQESWVPRYVELYQRRDGLTEAEHTELITLIDKLEGYQVRRFEWLLELARLRKTNVTNLIKDLQIKPPIDV